MWKKNNPFKRTFPLQPLSRNCSPAPDLVLWSPIWPKTLLWRSCIFSHTHTHTHTRTHAHTHTRTHAHTHTHTHTHRYQTKLLRFVATSWWHRMTCVVRHTLQHQSSECQSGCEAGWQVEFRMDSSLDLQRRAVRPISVLRFWISEGLTQAES